ncbi:DinB family protein [Sinomicrobium sp. FJxs]|uniref:DinB family protein n=2 Tax=Sinomicrobium weinanense TaxID=2842200 RepID=A0A926JUN2_9FLAO|nr:DinB family protein [Sinomicrobium weinanense]MBU3123902.1 DinB family protein [Sinomicrobium weinanense]
MLFSSVQSNLDDLTDLAEQLSSEEYNAPCPELGGATIGQHFRHIIEIFLCLINNYETGSINYDKRERNRKIETDITTAVEHIDHIKENLEKENKPLFLEQTLNCTKLRIQSSYFREVLYNLEHTIHHQALMRVGIRKFDRLILSESFGVAPSTIEYRKKCAQ